MHIFFAFVYFCSKECDLPELGLETTMLSVRHSTTLATELSTEEKVFHWMGVLPAESNGQTDKQRTTDKTKQCLCCTRQKHFKYKEKKKNIYPESKVCKP